MADFRLDRFKFNWKGSWQANVNYRKDDVVHYRGKSYVCKLGHTSKTVFDLDLNGDKETLTVTINTDNIDNKASGVFYINGEEKPEISLIRGSTYVFNQTDVSNTTFNNDYNPLLLSLLPDGTLGGGNVYQEGVKYFINNSAVTYETYLSSYQASSSRRIEFTVPDNSPERIYYFSTRNQKMGASAFIKYDSKWELMTDGSSWRGEWQSDVYYTEGDIVKYGTYFYKCIDAHTSTIVTTLGLPADIENWEIATISPNWRSNWQVETEYLVGDVVVYSGQAYTCIGKHVSSDNLTDGLESSIENWEYLTESSNWLTDWTAETKYNIGDVIRYGATVYRCILSHTSASSDSLGLENNQGNWEIVTRGIDYKGVWTDTFKYKVNDVVKYGGALWKAKLGHIASGSLRGDVQHWDIFVPGIETEDVWSPTVEYNLGDIVTYGGYAYIALTNNFESVPSVNGILQDTGDWEIVTRGYRFIGDWNSSIEYLTGDVVRLEGYIYVCIEDNINNNPELETSIWVLLVEGQKYQSDWTTNTNYNLGDVVTRTSTAYICILGHNSDTVDSQPDIDVAGSGTYWVTLVQGDTSAVLTDPGDIRVYDTTNSALNIGNSGNVLTVNSSTMPDWALSAAIDNILYVSIDGTDQDGNGTSLAAPFRTVKYACQYIFDNYSYEKINTYNYDKTGQVDTYMLSEALKYLATPGNTFVTATNFENGLKSTNPKTGAPYFDLVSNGGTEPTYADADWIAEYLGGQSTDITAEGVRRIQDLLEYLQNNANSYADESFVGLDGVTYQVTDIDYPNTTVFIKTGLYREQLPIKIPRNCALVGDELRSTQIMPADGYESENMFFVNNGCGIRNMTLQGLYGTLSGLNQYLTRRPTAGAYVSLDAGVGPTDISVWITNKSPYVQNVTTFGTGCIGMKVDGALHNGGNDSMVANDFTQVLDDGIGYWAINSGRSELVSVFTYFCHIGYLAEDGGIVRATNGNNSYGEYGSVAEGFDQNELPISGTIDNRTKDAQFGDSFTFGTTQQEILAIGYSNAGRSYSSANISFGGAGVNGFAEYDEFRQQAIDKIRITAPGDSTTPGGLGYTKVSNTAQSGDTGSITIAQSDVGTSEIYIGQRIVIVSGVGVGQYAEITGFDEVSKKILVSRESDGQNGWEHFAAGWPIEPVLNETTVYQIEPKPTFDIIDPESSLPAANVDTSGTPTSYAIGAGRIARVNAISNKVSPAQEIIVTVADIDDLNNWSSVASASAQGNATSPGIVWTGSTFWTGINGAVIGGRNGAIVSTDGINWQSNTFAPDISANMTSVASNGNSEIVVAADDVLYYSDNDGSTWSSNTINALTNISKVLAVKDKYLVFYNNGRIGEFLLLPGIGNQYTSEYNIPNCSLVKDAAYGNNIILVLYEDEFGNTYLARNFSPYPTFTSWNVISLNTDYDGIIYGPGQFILTSSTTTSYGYTKGGDFVTEFGSDSAAFNLNSNTFGGVYVSDGNYVASNINGFPEIINFPTIPIVRTLVSNSRISSIVIYDPGSGVPGGHELTILDNSNTIDATYEFELNDGVLAQPRFVGRGQGYVNLTASITGNGFADIYQTGKRLFLNQISQIPGPGANLEINGIGDVQYSVVEVISQTGTGPFDVEIGINPPLDVDESPIHGEQIIIREQYSQIRLTGHDFLDIGTGNVSSTRYPTLYLEGEDSENARQPFNETVAKGGGRVFYTSTDQDGNFRVGELFEVEQNTGIVSVNATQFDLKGLTSLTLGGIVVGGSAVVIREFSKERTFVANSNNIVPTEASIKKYLESRISGGGSNAQTNRLVAGQIEIGGQSITTTSDLQVNVGRVTKIKQGIDGHYLASQIFLSK